MMYQSVSSYAPSFTVGIDRDQSSSRAHHPSAWNAFLSMVHCIKGQGEFIVNGQRSIISKGQGLLIYSQISHIYQLISEDWMVHFIGFGGASCKEILHALQMYETGVYYLSVPEIFEQHLQTLCQVILRDLPRKSLELSRECYNFLLDSIPLSS